MSSHCYQKNDLVMWWFSNFICFVFLVLAQVSPQQLLEGVKFTWSQNTKQFVLIRSWEKAPFFVHL
jgi:hypothetical protein